MEELENNVIIQENYFCKSISGEEDENGNYKFEVEASNENLDLQNQITLQSALKKSEEYFVTNGVISDDHLHKTRNPDGSVETHKDKIIGEPVSVRFDPTTKKTYVKGILYAGIEAAKPYIDLLKNKSKLVKASIGGIMPKIRKNADGSETVTSFMWNDLALTCSPVNWTVGSAKFAKSMGIVDFCKSLNAETNGATLQKEDLEEKTTELFDMTDGDLSGEDEEDDVKKSDLDSIKETVLAIENGELTSIDEVVKHLEVQGFEGDKARATAFEIIKQGGQKMNKSNFGQKIDELLKSFSGDAEDDVKIEKSAPAEDTENKDMDLFDDDSDDGDDKEEVEKCGVKKSVDYIDATEMLTEMNDKMEALEKSNADLIARNEELQKSLEEVQENMLNVTKSFGDYLKTPNARTTVVEKSLDMGRSEVISKKPTAEDFEICKSVLIENAREGKISPVEVQFYTSEFQKSMKGQSYNKDAMAKICQMVRDSRK